MDWSCTANRSRRPTDSTVSELRKGGVRVLSRRNLESYLFDNEVLKALAASVEKADETEELLTKKESICAARIGDAKDDLKPASGEIYVACKNYWASPNAGTRQKSLCKKRLRRSSNQR